MWVMVATACTAPSYIVNYILHTIFIINLIINHHDPKVNDTVIIIFNLRAKHEVVWCTNLTDNRAEKMDRKGKEKEKSKQMPSLGNRE